MFRFLFAFLLAAPFALGQVEIEPFIDTSGAVITPGTAGIIPAWNGVPDDLIDTTLSYDGTNITLASGQLLLPDGSNAAPSLSFVNDPADGFWNDGVNSIVLALNGVLRYRLSTANFRITLDGTAAQPAIQLGNVIDVNSGPYHIAGDHWGMSMGGALVMDWAATNAAGAGADLVTISSKTGIMDGSDIFRAFVIDVESDDHIGGANSNTLIGLDIDGIAGDADAAEYGIQIGSGFDFAVNYISAGAFVNFAVDGVDLFNITSAVNGFKMDVEGTLGTSSGGGLKVSPNSISAMNGNDTQILFSVEPSNPGDHFGVNNEFWGVHIGFVGGGLDADAFEGAMYIGDPWDAHIVMKSFTSAPSLNAPTDTVAYSTDDNADYSGGGGNDCAFIAIDDAGGVTVIAIIKLNTEC